MKISFNSLTMDNYHLKLYNLVKEARFEQLRIQKIFYNNLVI